LHSTHTGKVWCNVHCAHGFGALAAAFVLHFFAHRLTVTGADGTFFIFVAFVSASIFRYISAFVFCLPGCDKLPFFFVFVFMVQAWTRTRRPGH
jgi:hypothetical protein